MKPVDRRSLFQSVIKALAILLLLSVAMELTNIDQALADLIYQWEGNQWHFKNEWFTAILIHKGGKYLSIGILLAVLLAFLATFFSPALASWKYRLRYLLIATVSGTLVISVGKSISNISCPWDFSRYGGTLEYLSLMEQLWVRNGSQCFPAGHASSAFAWISLYFVGLHTKATWRWWALGAVLFFGALFGFSQQLRGAHFLSHDIWSFGICWMVSLTLYKWILEPYEPTK